MTTLAAQGVGFQQALFVPPESSYRKLGSAPEQHKDLSWQQGLQRIYQSNLGTSSSASVGPATMLCPSWHQCPQYDAQPV